MFHKIERNLVISFLLRVSSDYFQLFTFLHFSVLATCPTSPPLLHSDPNSSHILNTYFFSPSCSHCTHCSFPAACEECIMMPLVWFFCVLSLILCYNNWLHPCLFNDLLDACATCWTESINAKDISLCTNIKQQECCWGI